MDELDPRPVALDPIAVDVFLEKFLEASQVPVENARGARSAPLALRIPFRFAPIR